MRMKRGSQTWLPEGEAQDAIYFFGKMIFKREKIDSGPHLF